MTRLQPWSFAFAGAMTLSVLYRACARAVALFPDNTIGFFNTWFHGLQLKLLRPPAGRSLTLGQFIEGRGSAAVVSFATVASLGGFYHLSARVSARN